MSEKWKENHEKERSELLDKLDILYEAASLNYLNDDTKMVDWLHGDIDEDVSDSILRVTFANWASKHKILIEKPLFVSSQDIRKSIFANENEDIAFVISISDLLDRFLDVEAPLDNNDVVECLHAEIYKDGRIALIYLGISSSSEDTFDTLNGYEILGVDCSEQGFETHEYLSNLILEEMCFDYWVDDYQKSFGLMVDDYVVKNSDNHE